MKRRTLEIILFCNKQGKLLPLKGKIDFYLKLSIKEDFLLFSL